MPVSVDQFVQSLSQSGLIPAADVKAFLDGLPPTQRPPDGDTLAQLLVQSGKLTRYQAAAVAQGKGKNLVFGDYRVLDKLGQGGMGVVLKAEHRRMKRAVAVKIISPAAMKSPEAVKRFYREVEAAAKLIHPNIVTAFDATEHQGMHYLVMEYIEGKDLAAIVKEHGPLPVRQAVECVLQAARGLQYAHEQGIVHRDIKPANLLLDKKGTVKILDMGLARVAGLGDEPGAERLTQSGQVMGTCDYMAPEQSLDTHKADARADIYSLGCTLYRLLTGKTPYTGESYAKLFMAHLNDPIPSICDTRPDVPAELDAVFQKMVAKQADDRQQSMTEVIADLEGCLGMRRGGAADEESLSNGALSFLREMTAGGAATRHVAGVKVQQTFDHNGHPETGTNIGLRLLRAVRRQKPLVIALGIALAAAAAMILFGIIITIRDRSGKKTTISVPEGSQVAISKDGQVDITPPAPGSAGGKVDDDWQRSEKRWGLKRSDQGGAETPKGGFDPTLAARGERSPWIGPDGNWKLPPGAPTPAIAPFDAKKAREHQESWAKHLAIPVEDTNSIGMKLALIPPGEFDMGSTAEDIASEIERAKKNKTQGYLEQVPAEGPRHRVKITKPFYLAMYQVTQGEYKKVIGVNPSAFTEKQMDVSAFKPPLLEAEIKPRESVAKKVVGKDTSRHPVETVNRDEAMEFCRRLSAMPAERAARRVYRLATEAEWEYACRAGTTTRWSCGDDEAGLADVAWFSKNSGYMTHPVGEKRPNGWSLFDMHGNVRQWCADWFSADYYKQSPPNDPAGPPAGSSRVVRGGFWQHSASTCRSAYRNNPAPATRSHINGFRVVAEIAVKTEAGRPKTDSADSAGLQSPVPSSSPFIGPGGNWKLPPGAPQPAIAPFDAKKGKEHQESWAKHLAIPVEETNSIGMKLALIPPGEFDMGSTPEEIAWALEEGRKKFPTDKYYFDRVPGEGPRHRVKISKPFYLAMYQVTQGEYEKVMGVNPSAFSAKQMEASGFTPPLSEIEIKNRLAAAKKVAGQDTSRHAVETVSWEDSEEFCRRLSAMPEERKAKRVYGLPTEAQWEYACRAGTTTRWWCGDDEADLAECAWYNKNAGSMTHPVGEKKANAWGLYDMHGNVWQWCADWYDARYYGQSPGVDPTGPSGGSPRVVRGGSWGLIATYCRSAFRHYGGSGARAHNMGLRVCLVSAE